MFRSIFAIVRQNIRKWSSNPRFLVLVLFLIVTFWHQLQGIADSAEKMEVGINVVTLFPMLYSNSVGLGRVIMGAGILLVFCDAPFIDRNQQFVISRAGKGRFCVAQILYIVITSAVYTCILAIAPCLFTKGRIGVSDEWGTLFRSTVQGGNGILGNIVISARMMERYSALEAFFYETSIFFLIALFLGLIIYLFNLLIGRMSGIVVAGILLVLGEIPYYFDNANWVYWLSPVSFAEITHIDINGITEYPTFQYVYRMLLISIVILIVVIYGVFQRSHLIVKEEI